MTITDFSHRRALVFHSLHEVMPEVRRVMAGHRTAGNWSLGQICHHLAVTVNGSIDGLGLRNHRWKRRLAGKALFLLTLRYGIPPGFTVDSALTPPTSVDLSESISALEGALDRYLAHAGPLQAHPLFGRLSRKNWDRMHRFHCAHHLSFVIPLR